MAEKSLVVRISADIAEYKAQLSKAQEYLQQHAAQFRKIGTAMTATGATMTAFFTKAVQGAAQEQVAQEKLINALKNVKGATEGGAQALLKQAAALQQLTGYEDDQIVNAQAMLATFQLTDAQIAQITPRLLDMAAATEKSTGQQADLQAIAIALGKGFTGTAGSLSRYGVVLSEEAKKTGDFNLILNDLDKNFKGAGETVGQTFTGQMRIMKATVGDVMEVIGGKLIPLLMPLVQKFSEIAQSVIKWMDANQGLMKVLVPVVAAVGGLMTVLGPILILLPSLAAGFTMLTGPVGLVIAAIAGLITVGTLVVKNWDGIKQFLIDCWTAIQTVATSVWTAIKDFFVSIFETIKTIFTAAWEAIKLIVTTYFGLYKTIIMAAVDGIIAVFNFLKDTVVGVVVNLFNSVKEWFEKLFNKVGEIATAIKDKVVGAFTGMWKKIVGGSIVPTMVSQVIDQFKLMQTSLAGSMKNTEQVALTSFGNISDYASAMQNASSGAFTSMADSLRTSARAIKDTLEKQAIAYIITKVMAALPFPFNLVAVGGAIATVKALFSAIKLAEGGIVTRPTLALIGEKGPEAVIPLGSAAPALADATGKITLNVHFYGDVNNAGDLDEISRCLAERLDRLIQGGRI